MTPPREKDVGERLRRFGPMPANLVAGWMLATLAGGLGLCLFGCALTGGWGPWPPSTCGVLGAGLLIGAVALMGYVRWLGSQYVDFCTGGLRYVERGRVRVVAWDDIASVRETLVYDGTDPAETAIPLPSFLNRVRDRRYLIVSRAGSEFPSNRNTMQATKRFGVMLREQAERANIPWHTDHVYHQPNDDDD